MHTQVRHEKPLPLSGTGAKLYEEVWSRARTGTARMSTQAIDRYAAKVCSSTTSVMDATFVDTSTCEVKIFDGHEFYHETQWLIVDVKLSPAMVSCSPNSSSDLERVPPRAPLPPGTAQWMDK